MQLPGQAPKFVTIGEYYQVLGETGIDFQEVSGFPMKLPTIVFSHGLTGSPISSGYVSVLVEMAAHGFVVAGVFHGDPRFSLVRIENLSDALYLLAHFSEVVELEALRPLSLKVDARQAPRRSRLLPGYRYHTHRRLRRVHGWRGDDVPRGLVDDDFDRRPLR